MKPPSPDPLARDQLASPFSAILQRLCESCGAQAAALVDAEGETVDYAGRVAPFDARVAAAEWRLVLAEIEASKVFGWTVEEQEMPGMGTYNVWKDGEHVRGGMMDISGMPAEVPPHWLVYFTVPDADAAAETTKAAGGQLLNGPFDIRVGRLAILMDPQGAMFAVMASSDETRENAP